MKYRIIAILVFTLLFSCEEDSDTIEITKAFISSNLMSTREGADSFIVELELVNELAQDVIFVISILSEAEIDKDFQVSESVINGQLELIIPRGERTASVIISPLDDYEIEENESIELTINLDRLPQNIELVEPTISLIITDNTINNDLLARYLFTENANDSGPNLINGNVTGAMLVSDRFGKNLSCYDFDGINDFMEINHSELLNFASNQNFSISFWISVPENNLSGDIISKWNTEISTGYPFAIRYIGLDAANSENFKKVAFLRYDSDLCSNNPLVFSSLVNTNQWTHFVVRKIGSNLQIFQDGNLVGESVDSTESACETKNNASIIIGKRGINQSYFEGSVDDIYFYDRALLVDEIILLTDL